MIFHGFQCQTLYPICYNKWFYFIYSANKIIRIRVCSFLWFFQLFWLLDNNIIWYSFSRSCGFDYCQINASWLNDMTLQGKSKKKCPIWLYSVHISVCRVVKMSCLRPFSWFFVVVFLELKGSKNTHTVYNMYRAYPPQSRHLNHYVSMQAFR